MRHDQQQHAGSRPGRNPTRKEWLGSGDQAHQMEAREHARLPGEVRRVQGIREAQAERQIRELRLRN